MDGNRGLLSVYIAPVCSLGPLSSLATSTEIFWTFHDWSEQLSLEDYKLCVVFQKLVLCTLRAVSILSDMIGYHIYPGGSENVGPIRLLGLDHEGRLCMHLNLPRDETIVDC